MIKVQDLDFYYKTDQQRVVLDSVNLSIEPGEFLTILGRNGSGKSTLAKHFNAILLPEGGKVYVDSMDTMDEQLIFDIRQKVGMVFQNPDNHIVATLVEDDVAFAPENLGVPPEEIVKRVDEALQIVGMSEYKKHAPHLLSGGQKQRVAIAGVIAMKPKYLIFDEPTAMLDPIGRREVIRTIKKLNREEGLTIILITHNMEEAVESDRIVVIDRGNIIKEGTPSEIFSCVDEMNSLGLDVPQVTKLTNELVKAGIPMPQDILTTEQFDREFIKILEGK